MKAHKLTHRLLCDQGEVVYFSYNYLLQLLSIAIIYFFFSPKDPLQTGCKMSINDCTLTDKLIMTESINMYGCENCSFLHQDWLQTSCDVTPVIAFTFPLTTDQCYTAF